MSRLWPDAGRHLWASGGTSRQHAHARGHLVYAARGVLSVHTPAGTSIVPADRIAWTPPGTPHSHRAHGGADMRIVFVPPSVARLVPDRPVVFLASGLAREAVLALTDDSEQRRAARARLRRVLVDQLREAPEQPLQLPEPRDDRLRALARILRDEPADNTSLAGLGRRVGASQRSLSRLLHDELGRTFHEWRTQLRIAHALVLLAEGHDVTRTAHACGWSSPSSFVTAFATLVGTTPGRYRAASRPGDVVAARPDGAGSGHERRGRH